MAIELVHSPWHREYPKPVGPALTGDVRSDVVVIGGGISGLSSAWYLSRAGFDVVLLEREAVGAQPTIWSGLAIARVSRPAQWFR